jgi:cobyrinic acid a,c-diamide synthase
MFHLPRIVVAGLAGDSGKTLVSLGMTRAFRQQGLCVAPFKKGPDYIDAAWLSLAAGRDAHNLDTFLSTRDVIIDSLNSEADSDIAVIEGNRGVFDGCDASGSHSTAELARCIAAPVVLVIDVSKATRTIAAYVLGCVALEPDLPIAGVILNRVATARQEKVIRDSIACVSKIPIIGTIPKLPTNHLPSRHLGLTLPEFIHSNNGMLDELGGLVSKCVDLAAVKSIARTAPPLCAKERNSNTGIRAVGEVRIGVIRDAAFSFYYPENLKALEAQGARLVTISAIEDQSLPPMDALYIGGGYPEAYAEQLSTNTAFRCALASRIESGLPVWAECGGLMYLSKSIEVNGVAYPMVGALPIEIEQTNRPQGHGYVEARVVTKNPFLSLGTTLRGHEFHFSRIRERSTRVATALELSRGSGVWDHRDGVIIKNVFASYMHVFAPGVPDWAPSLIRVARKAHLPPLQAIAIEGEQYGKYYGRSVSNRSRRGWIHSGA